MAVKHKRKKTTAKKTKTRRQKQKNIKKILWISLSVIIAFALIFSSIQIIKAVQKERCETNDYVLQVESDIVALVNQERVARGLQPLIAHEELSDVARIKSYDMMMFRYFRHNSLVYGSPFRMIKSFKIEYSRAGENIAKGYPSAQAAMTGWMNSKGHKANILSQHFTHIGVGVVVGDDGVHYYTQMFLTP